MHVSSSHFSVWHTWISQLNVSMFSPTPSLSAWLLQRFLLTFDTLPERQPSPSPTQQTKRTETSGVGVADRFVSVVVDLVIGLVE
jgi:hypothetical protein